MAETLIAFLRGVNVGGAHCLSMKELARLLESLGLTDVRTYIQSGNAVFRSSAPELSELSEKIKAKIQRKCGFGPEVLLLRLKELESAIASNPYPAADSDPKALHLIFLPRAPKDPDLGLLEKVRANDEEFTLIGRVFYVYAPAGVGRSKLFTKIDKALGVSGTARNWRTVCKMRELAL